MSKTIKNINILDLTTAAEQALDGVTKIKNANVILYSKNTAALLSGIALKNVNICAEVPENCKLIQVNDSFEIDDSISANDKVQSYIVLNGTLIVKPNVSIETIEQSIAGIVMNGEIYCPEKVKGAIQNKIVQQNGKIMTYMDDADSLNSHLRIDNTLLSTLQAGSRLSFVGKTVLLDRLDASMLDNKIEHVEFLGQVIIREEILESLTGKIVNSYKCKFVVIPKGATYIDNDFALDAAAMGTFDQSKLYITGVLHFESDVTPEDVRQAFESIHTDRMVICRKELKEEVLKRSDDPSVKVLDYTGKLLVVNSEYKLTQTELQYMNEPLSIIVHGMLDIAENMDPQTLFEKIERIDNFGVISGSSEQCGVIQTKLRTNKGEVSYRDNSDTEESHPPMEPASPNENGELYIKNMNYLKL